MRRMRFSTGDLARTRVIPTIGRTGETLFARELLARGGGGEPFRKWRADVRNRLSGGPRSLTVIARSRCPVPDLSPVTGVDTELRDFYQVAVAPYWTRVRSHLEAERETRGRVMLTGGFDLLFGTLHALVRWEPPYLLVPGDVAADVPLHSRGLLLAPSLFLTDKPRLMRHGDAPVLVYPAPPTETLWNVAGDGPRALGALVGRTRAEMLRVLADTCTSGELGRRLGLSSATVSQHTSVLRSTGLIASRRKANTVSHSITPLGATLLKAHPHLGEW